MEEEERVSERMQEEEGEGEDMGTSCDISTG